MHDYYVFDMNDQEIIGADLTLKAAEDLTYRHQDKTGHITMLCHVDSIKKVERMHNIKLTGPDKNYAYVTLYKPTKIK